MPRSPAKLGDRHRELAAHRYDRDLLVELLVLVFLGRLTGAAADPRGGLGRAGIEAGGGSARRRTGDLPGDVVVPGVVVAGRGRVHACDRARPGASSTHRGRVILPVIRSKRWGIDSDERLVTIRPFGYLRGVVHTTW
nr:hypothetical protein GCM10020092_007950 [Actinoplanes digitatis]